MEKNSSIGYYLFENLLQIISKNFKISSKENFLQFEKGVKHYKQFVFLQDQIVDSDIDWVSQFLNNENILLDYTSHYRKAINHLSKTFAEDHAFWEYLEQEETLYYDFIIKEKYYNSEKSALTLQDFEEMTYAKHNLALVPIKGMEWLFESVVSYENIKSIFVPIFNGMQMMDDIDDFSKDLKSGQWNMIQYEVQKVIADESLVNDGTLDQFEERVFYASDLCSKHSNYALLQYQEALLLAEKFKFTDLKHWLEQVIVEVKQSIELVNKINS